MAAEWIGLGRVERFVRAVVVGGIALVGGLRSIDLFASRSLPWLAGIGLVVAGLTGLACGIASQLSV